MNINIPASNLYADPKCRKNVFKFVKVNTTFMINIFTRAATTYINPEAQLAPQMREFDNAYSLHIDGNC